MEAYRSQEELVDLFAKSLHVSVNPSTPNQQFSFSTSKTPIYASQHYTPSAYLTSPYNAAHDTSDAAIDYTLRQHSIDPTFLFPAQIQLFRSATPDLRLRLLELWRTAPLQASDKDAIRQRYGEPVETNLLQEEILTRLRLERRLLERDHGSVAEPYMANGYDGDLSASSMDSTPEGSTGLWTAGQVTRRDEQYGMFVEDFERLQELHRRVEGRQIGAGVMDDEMVV